ncbi:MAG: fasciclin domain-containing protein [bacterium]
MKNIIETAIEAGLFKTLITAVQAAGLAETLSRKGPFTLLAPTDDAFSKIPKDTLAAVLADKEKLTAILTYHVIAGKIMASDVINLTSAKTIQGSEINIKTLNGVTMNEAKVLKTDIECSNGVIHIIDSVLMPKKIYMKKMKCSDMGGPCNYEMMADTPEDMMKMGSDHVMTTIDKAHMKIAEQMKTMTSESNKIWNDMFMKKWKAIP